MEPFNERITQLEANLDRLLKEAGDISSTLQDLKSTMAKPAKETPATPPPLPVALAPIIKPVLSSAKVEPSKEAPLAKPAPVKKPQYNGGLELQLGRVWFVRIGIILLTTGLVFLSSYTYHNYVRDLAPGTRLGLFYLFSALITGAGLICENWKDSLKSYGRIVAAGGLATIYYCSFAAYHVEALKVIESPVMASILLTLSAGLFCGVSLWKQSRVMLSTSLGLAFYSVSINPNGLMVCISSLILAAFGITMMRRTNWMTTGFVVLIGSYLSFAWWQLTIAQASDDTHFFLIAYWLLFVAASLAPKQVGEAKLQGLFSTINHSAFFLLFSLDLKSFTWIDHHWAFSLILGTALLGIGLLGKERLPKNSLILHFTKGIGLITLGISLKLSGHLLFLTLLIESLLILAVCFRHHHPMARLASQLVAALGLLFACKHLVSLTEVTPIPWVIAAVLLFAYGIIDRLVQRNLDSHRENPISIATNILAFLFIFLGATASWSHEYRLLLIALPGIIAPLGMLNEKLRPVILDLLATCIGASAIALIILFGQSPPTPTAIALGACIALLTSAAHSIAQSKAKNALSQSVFRINSALHMGIGILFLIIEIFLRDFTAETRLFLLSLIPITGTLISLKTKSKGHSTIPAIAYPALFLVGSANETMILLTSFLTLAHFIIVHQFHTLGDKPLLEKVTYLLTTLFFLLWMMLAFDHALVPVTWCAAGLLLTARFAPKKLTYFSSSIYFVVASILFLSGGSHASSLSVYFALLVPMALHLWTTRQIRTPQLNILAIGTILALWIQVTRDNPLGSLSTSWAITGTLILLVGLIFRSRAFRLAALTMLLASLGHVMLIDIVKLDPLPRILSFITLGLGLLALGFVYNRWQERLKEIL
ncbi:DUF2339 domain-containing protein [Akkermansiaceae bacterium]|nr:DUF2339 domain-containing protein [Akkermansiaceae bacterium]MDA7887914.1 DUF2339 domain-containing protein [Akkermansiaceae bacterium]